jgi:polysaccharide biosynthesis protein PelC
MKKKVFKQFCAISIQTILCILLTACSIHEIQQTAPLSARASWIMLPFTNHSDSPEAGERVADIAATLLRSQHHIQLQETHIPTEQASPELNQQKLITAAINWGKQQKYQYGLGGSVQEWHYKSGLDGEPAVGITLTLINLATGEVVWSAVGSKTGWGRESVSGTGQKLLTELLDGLPLTEQ